MPGFLGTLEELAFFHIDSVTKAAGSSAGTIDWTFSAPDLAFDYLAAGQTVTLTYTVEVNDHSGGTSTQTVAITVTGSNDAPTFVSGPGFGHDAEDFHVSQAGNLTSQGTLLFADVDLADKHTLATASLVSSSLSTAGAIIPTGIAADLANALSLTLHDFTGTGVGSIGWSFALSNSDVQFLAKNETLTLTYDVTVTDPSNASAIQTVTVTIAGANDAPVITSGPETGHDDQDFNVSQTGDLTSQGTLQFTDVDLTDIHTVAAKLVSSSLSTDGAVIPAAISADLANALSLVLHDSNGTGAGSIDWSFALPNSDIQFLSGGERLTLTYDVTVTDPSHASSTQTVTVTIDGANDAPKFTGGTTVGTALEETLVTQAPTTTVDFTSSTLNFTDPDLIDTHTASASYVANSAAGPAAMPA